MWLGAASFLQLTNNKPQHLTDRLRGTKTAIQNALDWMAENQTDHVQRGVSGGSEAISRNSVLQLKAFYETIEDRFANQIKAIQQSKR